MNGLGPGIGSVCRKHNSVIDFAKIDTLRGRRRHDQRQLHKRANFMKHVCGGRVNVVATAPPCNSFTREAGRARWDYAQCA
eukprot:11743929-Heterocapsa_arctica.AAC.1